MDHARRARTILLSAVAILATFAIGLLAGTEIFRPPLAPQDAPTAGIPGPAAAVSPKLLIYRELTRIPVALEHAGGLASQQDGSVWVCGDASLLHVSRTGKVEKRISLDGDPTAIALGADGRVFVGLGTRIIALNPATGATDTWPDLGSQAIITSITAGPSAVWVADAGNRMLMGFDLRGKLVGTISGGFVVPSTFFDCAFSLDGTLWVANPGAHGVRQYSAQGKLLASWGESSTDTAGFMGCCNPAHLAVLPCGAVVTGEKGLLRVKVYETDGSLNSVVAQPADFPAAETGIYLATRKANGGEILVLVPSEKSVRVYVKKGASTDG